MEWKQVTENLHRAITPHGLFTVEKRIGCWMAFDPWDNEPFLIGAPDVEFCKREAEDWYANYPYKQTKEEPTND